MNKLNQELIIKQNNREKELLDTFIAKRGLSVLVKPPTLLENGVPAHTAFDDFEIDIPRVSLASEHINTESYDVANEFNTQLTLESESFGEPKPVTTNELMSYLMGDKTDTDTANNFSVLFAYVKADIILPNGTIIELEDFENMTFIVESVTKKKQLSKIFRYKLGRT